MDLQFELCKDSISIVRPRGRLDLLTAPGVKQQVAAVIREGYVYLLVDLAEITFIDSSGLGVLLGSLKSARLAGGDLRIARPTEQARVILELTTLDRILKPYTSVEDALVVFKQAVAH